jgi:tRNA-Thr(GGU) m(6)t(6)A37 methyltransferase TsaA
MTARSDEIRLKPIGVVRSEVKAPGRHEHEDTVAEIIIEGGLTEALDALEEFSHIIVLWWVHKTRRPYPMKVHPRRNPEHELVGVLASRSPDRPNPIGQSMVRLLERRGNVLKVQGLDAIVGTPVLDIKPYCRVTIRRMAQTPAWTNGK